MEENDISGRYIVVVQILRSVYRKRLGFGIGMTIVQYIIIIGQK